MKKTIEDGISLVSEKGKRIINYKDLLELHGLSEEMREVIKQTANVWEVAMNKKDGSTELVQLHQVKAEIKPISPLVKDDIRNILIKHFNDKIPTIPSTKYEDGELLATINLADLHIGRVEEKNPNKYIKGIQDRTLRLFESLLKEKPDKIILGSLGDQANSEFNGMTSSGKNRQDNGMNAKEMFEKVLGLHFELGKALSSELPTEMIIIPGNHDRNLMSNVGTALEIGFSKSDVIVDNEDKPRKYRKRGNTNLAYSHGDGEKPKQRLGIMSQEMGLNKYNEWTIGHFHEKKVEQYGPLEVNTIPSPAVQSEREKNQFAHKTAKLEGNLYDKKRGKINTFYK